MLAAADPAQPYGAALPWPKRDGEDQRSGRAGARRGRLRRARDDRPVLYVERGGRGLVTLSDSPALRSASAASPGREPDPLREALEALAEAVRSSRVPKLTLERIDGEPAIGSQLAPILVELGFQSGPRRLTLSA